MQSRGYSLKDMSLDSQYEYGTSSSSWGSSGTSESLPSKMKISNWSSSGTYSGEEIAKTPLMAKQEGPRTEDSYVMEYIGGGAQGKIYKSIVKATNETLAVKVVKMTNPLQRKFAITEVENLMRVTKGGCHPFIVCYYNYFLYDDRMLIEMEYVNGKTLTEWSRDYRSKSYFNLLDENLVHLTKDLAKALQYIHERNTIHRDIKPDNIMITPEKIPKLVDFGLACKTETCYLNPPTNPNIVTLNCCTGRSGTPVFMAREVIQTSVSYFASDIWSLGATILNATTGKYCYMFANDNDMEAVFQIILNEEPLILETENRKLNRAVNSMLQVDMLRRPTAAQIVAQLS